MSTEIISRDKHADLNRAGDLLNEIKDALSKEQKAAFDEFKAAMTEGDGIEALQAKCKLMVMSELAPKLAEMDQRFDNLDKALKGKERTWTAGTDKQGWDRTEACRKFGAVVMNCRESDSGRREEHFTPEYKEAIEHHRAYLRAQNETTDTAGGVTVPIQWYDGILRLVQEKSYRDYCMVTPMQGDKLVLPNVSGGLTAAILGEGSSLSDVDITLASQANSTIDSAVVGISGTLSRELAEDAIRALEITTGELYAEGIGVKENQIIFSQATTFSGIVQSLTASQIYTMPTGSTHYSTVNYSDLVSARMHVNVSEIKDSVYAVGPDALTYILRKTDNNGQPVFYNAYGNPTIAGGFPGGFSQPVGPAPVGQILLAPVLLTEQLPATSSSGLIWSFFGNMKRAVFGDRRKIVVEQSDHAKLTTRQRLYVVTERIAFGVLPFAVPLIASNSKGAFCGIKTA